MRWEHNRRTQIVKVEGGEVEMPDLADVEYLWAAFQQTGCAMRDAMGGEIPLSWAEVAAFCECSTLISTSWEKLLLRDLSVAYVDGKIRGRDVRSIPPIDVALEEQDDD